MRFEAQFARFRIGYVEDVEDAEEDNEVDEEEEEEEEKAVPWTGLKTLPVGARACGPLLHPCSLHGFSSGADVAWGNVLQERDDLLALLEELKEAGKKQLTVLLLGQANN